MAYLTTDIEWHDVRIDPEDLPAEEEPILVTIELLDGRRVTWLDVYLRYASGPKELDDLENTYFWVTRGINEFNKIEETQVWYPVVAWAYPPAPLEAY